jgi:flagellar biosynthesis protein FlhG
MKTLDELDHYDVLEVSRDARPETIERAYLLVRAAYDGDSLAAYGVFAPDEAKLWRERIDEAWRVLSDAATRRAYDASLAALEGLDEPPDLAAPASDPVLAGASLEAAPPPARPLPEAPSQFLRPEAPRRSERPLPIEEAPAQEAAALPRELAAFDEAGVEEDGADWSGPRLRRARMVRGLEIEDVATATKINPAYLRFLEDERFDDLPAVVYVRGFVAAYARHLGLDAARVARSYAARCEEHRHAKPPARFLGRR